MSSIIKGERIRGQSIIDFSNRPLERFAQEGYIKETKEQISSEENKELTYLKEEKLKDIQQLVNAKLEQANNQANQIVLEAVQKSKALEEEAKQLKTQMLFEIEAHKAKVLEEAHQEAERIIASAYEEKAELIKNTEAELVETLITLLHHIISEEMSYETEWLKCLVRKMVNKEGISGQIKVIISPILYAKLHEEELAAIKTISKELTVETSEQISETTCMIEFNQGSIVYDVAQGVERVIKDIRILMNTK